MSGKGKAGKAAKVEEGLKATNLTELAEHLGVSVQMARRYRRRGMIRPDEDGIYDVAEAKRTLRATKMTEVALGDSAGSASGPAKARKPDRGAARKSSKGKAEKPAGPLDEETIVKAFSTLDDLDTIQAVTTELLNSLEAGSFMWQKIRGEAERSNKLTLERMELQEKLVRKDYVVQEVAGMIRNVRDRFMTLPEELEELVARESDPVVCRGIIAGRVRRILEQLATPLAEEKAA